MEHVADGEANDFAQFASAWDAGLTAIEAPTLIVHGTEDELIPFSEATFLDAGIANSTLVAKDGQDHLTVVFFEFAENLRAAA